MEREEEIEKEEKEEMEEMGENVEGGNDESGEKKIIRVVGQ